MVENNYKELFDKLKGIKDSNEYLNKLVLIISQVLFDRDTFVKNSENEEQRNIFFRMLSEKIEETYQKYKGSNSDASDIMNEVEFIGAGHTSLAFRIGNMVLKVGKSDSQWTSMTIKKCNDFPCLIPVLYDETMKVAEKEFYSMQLSPLVDIAPIEEEELYGCYKELRKLGYIWNDPLPENVGRIKADLDFNGHYYQKGDFVIIDLEDIAFVGEDTSDEVLEEISMMSYNRRTYTYEARYLEEKGKGK